MKTKHARRPLAPIALSLALVAHAPALDLPGTWDATASTEEGERRITWAFAKDGDGFTGTSTDNESGEVRKLDRVKVGGDTLTIEVDFERDGDRGMVKVVAEQAAPGELAGRWSMQGADGTVYAEGAVAATKRRAPSAVGEWSVLAKVPEGDDVEATLTIEEHDAGLSATFENAAGGQLAVDQTTLEGGALRLQFTMGDDDTTVVVEAEFEGEDKLAGVWVVPGREGAKGDWQATRVDPGYAGEWAVSAGLPDGGEYSGVLTLDKDGDRYSGRSKSSDGEERELVDVKVDGAGGIGYHVPVDTDGLRGKITVSAAPGADGALVGRWKLVRDSGEQVADGDWKAVRKK